MTPGADQQVDVAPAVIEHDCRWFDYAYARDLLAALRADPIREFRHVPAHDLAPGGGILIIACSSDQREFRAVAPRAVHSLALTALFTPTPEIGAEALRDLRHLWHIDPSGNLLFVAILAATFDDCDFSGFDAPGVPDAIKVGRSIHGATGAK